MSTSFVEHTTRLRPYISRALLLAPAGYVLASICRLALGWRQTQRRHSVLMTQSHPA